MRKRIAGSLVGMACIIGLFVSCDSEIRSKLSSLMGGMSNNIYEEAGWVESTVNTASVNAVADTASLASFLGVSEGSVTINDSLSVSTSAGAYLSPQSVTESASLISNLSAALSDEDSTAALQSILSTPADDTVKAAVNGSIQLVDDTIDAIRTTILEDASLSFEDKEALTGLLSSMEMASIPLDQMTQGDVVVVQAMTNLLSDAADTLTVFDASDANSVQAALDLIDRATTVAKAAAALSSTNTDFMAGVDFGSLVGSFTRSIHVRGTVTIDDDNLGPYLSTINAIAPKVFAAMGVAESDGSYSISETKWSTFVARMSQYRTAMTLGMTPIELYGNELQGKFGADMLGLDANTMMTYILSVVVTEVPKLFGGDTLATVGTFLDDNTALVAGTLEKGNSITYPDGVEVKLRSYGTDEVKKRLKASLSVVRTMNETGMKISEISSYLTDDLIDSLFEWTQEEE